MQREDAGDTGGAHNPNPVSLALQPYNPTTREAMILPTTLTLQPNPNP